MRLRYPYALALSASLVLLFYKLSVAARLAPLGVTLGWLLEVAALSALAALWGASQRVRGLAVFASASFLLLAHAVIVPSLSHTYFFESAAERRFSLLDVDLRTLGFFFSSVLPLRGALWMAGLLGTIHLGAYALARRGVPFAAPVPVTAVGGLTLCAVLLRVNPPLPSPLADLAHDLGERVFTAQLAIDRTRPARYEPRMLDRSALPAHGPAQYDKVLVFVMETMNSDVFEREAAALSADTFVHSALPHAVRYENYFATNQDSRTGMLSMLSSRFIPYEAYTEEGRDHYMFLGQRSSLVDAMKSEGYRTAFAVSQQEVELVVGDMAWDQVIHFDEGEDLAPLAKDHLCFVPYEFEHSCEDRALLPRVLAFLDQSPRAFLYQEFIWGHAIEYNRASGRTNTDYYSHYLDAIVQHLAQRGELDRTLIVLTSDHGVREKDQQRVREVYRLPLWFFTGSLAPRIDHQLRSHLDFKDLLFAHAFAGTREPAPSPFVLVIGPTGTSFVSLLTEPSQLLLMKARGDTRQLVHSQGYASGDVAGRTGADFLRLYEDYLGYFSRH
ncbi:MAG TPA: sulfatase-like hydrolase/transferase [Polyangiales bacterium]